LRIPTRTRKAISPVLATVILIAITLIAAIAVAGFVFGLFGTFTTTAQVSASVVSCVSKNGANVAVCTVSLTNTGSGNTAVNACYISVAGVNTAGTWAKTGGTDLKAGDNLAGTCTLTIAGNSVGSQAIGSVSLTNGGSVEFSGVWS